MFQTPIFAGESFGYLSDTRYLWPGDKRSVMHLKNRLSLLPFGLKILLLLMTCTVFLTVAVGTYNFYCVLTTGAEGILQSPSTMRIAQWIQSFFGFLFPSLLMAYLFSPSLSRYLCLNNGWQIKKMGIAITAYLFFIPVLNLVVYWNEHMQLPEFLNEVEVWMKNMEETNRGLAEKMMTADTWQGLVANILLIAVMTGICEELLFRGVIQRLVYDRYKNIHWAVWSTAIIFSAIHVQFYGFFPRLLMGAFFGYALVWSGSLYVPVVLHILNNAAAVVIDYLVKRGIVEADTLESIGTDSGTYVYAVLGGVLSVILLMQMRRSATKNYLPTGH